MGRRARLLKCGSFTAHAKGNDIGHRNIDLHAIGVCSANLHALLDVVKVTYNGIFERRCAIEISAHADRRTDCKILGNRAVLEREKPTGVAFSNTGLAACAAVLYSSPYAIYSKTRLIT